MAVLDAVQASLKSATAASNSPCLRLARVFAWIYAALCVGLACYLFLIPGVLVVRELAGLTPNSEEIPAVALRLHEDLTPRYERWARSRLSSGRAATLSTNDIAGTEWPLFGSVFYLWSTEAPRILSVVRLNLRLVLRSRRQTSARERIDVA